MIIKSLSLFVARVKSEIMMIELSHLLNDWSYYSFDSKFSLFSVCFDSLQISNDLSNNDEVI